MCVHRTEDGKCLKHSDNNVLSFCVDGPCSDEMPTNADRIRAMTDEELAKTLDMSCPPDTSCNDGQNCVKCWKDWLQQPAKEN